MAQELLKFIQDKSILSNPFYLIQWDADGDLAYVPVTPSDWLVTPTGALQALDELAERMTAVDPVFETKTGNFTAQFGRTYWVTAVADIQLPNPASNVGRRFEVIKVGSFTINLLRFSGEKIQGVAANKALTSDNESFELVTNGTDWQLA